MNGLLPIVEQLADCKADIDRARWLFSCPLAILYREDGAVRALLRQAGFKAGIDYLDVEICAMRATRGPYGMPTPDMWEARIGAVTALILATGGDSVRDVVADLVWRPS